MTGSGTQFRESDLGNSSGEVLMNACRVVFGEQVEVTPEFLRYLQPSGLKSAFRLQAKRVHPDLASTGGQELSFHDLKVAYELLARFLDERDGERVARAPKPEFRQTVRERHLYTGPIPAVRLEFGLYLFYRGVISSDELFEALRWQRKQRPAIGELAKKRGWLNDQQIRHALVWNRGAGRFGERCIELRLLSEDQVNSLVWFQRFQQRKLGEFFVEKGILRRAELEQLLRDFAGHNIRQPQRSPRRSNV